jgi:GNAT superfamily N-acetyltransferase
MSFIGQTLLDEITIKHGPAPLMGRFLVAANREMRSRGVTLALKKDLKELFAFNERNREHWYRLAPLFDPSFNDIPEEEAYWLAGYDSEGDIVAVHATRFFDWSETTLEEEFVSLRLWYNEPSRWRMPGEECRIACEGGKVVTGRCAFVGSMWFRPDFRGRGLSRLLPRISRTVALARWGIDFNFSFVESFVIATTLIDQYGYANYAPGVQFRNGPKGNMDMHLLWMHRDELVADLARGLRQFGEGAERMIEKPEANRSPASDRQGRISRS